MSSSVNGTSSISTADLALKKIPSMAWKNRGHEDTAEVEMMIT